MQRNNNKGAWSNEEDVALLNAMDEVTKEIGHVKWCLVSKRLPSRSPKQCRERFVYNLDPNISKAPWSKEEDAFLIYSQKNLGNAWARIASCLPGRTENSTKTRFKSIMRAQKRIWKKYEDDYILSQFQIVGSQWELIAQGLPGRTKNAIKTRYFLLTEGANSLNNAPLSRESVSSSFSQSTRSGDDDDDIDTDDNCLNFSGYVGNPLQALGLDDTELARLSACFSYILANELNSGSQSATQIKQETIKAAIAQSPLSNINNNNNNNNNRNNKRGRLEVLRNPSPESPTFVKSEQFSLETPKNVFSQQQRTEISQISPLYSYENSSADDTDNFDRFSKRQKTGIKMEPISSSAPIINQSQYLYPIDNCFDLFQYQNNTQEISTSFPSTKITSSRISLTDFADIFDFDNNNTEFPNTFGHDDGFGINLAEIEPISWGVTL